MKTARRGRNRSIEGAARPPAPRSEGANADGSHPGQPEIEPL
jgi:hypothetical protein